jgi:transposase-like protein
LKFRGGSSKRLFLERKKKLLEKKGATIMKKVLRVGEKGKPKLEAKEKRVTDDLQIRVELIQALIPLGLEAVGEVLAREVEELAGPRYNRSEGQPGQYRWGSQAGSVYLGEQKLPISRPRVRNQKTRQEVVLKTYSQLQQPQKAEGLVFKKILAGLSCRQYEACAEAIPETFGLSPSTVSRRFVQASAKRLQELLERDLSGQDFVALFMDGKTFAADEMVIALGVTLTGEKVILGLVQTATENEKVIKEFLGQLLDRGLTIEEGILVVIDGSKGMRAAIRKAFRDKAVIQRCQWHKRENVVSYLPQAQQKAWRKKLQQAYEQSTYEAARQALGRLKPELQLLNASAVNSLEEGLEETLTLHRLGLFKQLGKSFKTTNCLESIMSQVGQRTDKVDYWKNSLQKQRWVASALLKIEPSLRRVKGYRYLDRLREALKNEVIRFKEAA